MPRHPPLQLNNNCISRNYPEWIFWNAVLYLSTGNVQGIAWLGNFGYLGLFKAWSWWQIASPLSCSYEEYKPCFWGSLLNQGGQSGPGHPTIRVLDSHCKLLLWLVWWGHGGCLPILQPPPASVASRRLKRVTPVVFYIKTTVHEGGLRKPSCLPKERCSSEKTPQHRGTLQQQ